MILPGKRIVRSDILFAFFLFFAAFIWRIPSLMQCETPLGFDGYLSARTVFEIVRSGRFFIFLVGQTYMAPIEEAVSAFLFAISGPSTSALYLPKIFFYSLSTILYYFILLRIFPRIIAVGTALLLCFVNSAILYRLYTPDYSFIVLLVALILWYTLSLKKHASVLKWIFFGILCGFSIYVCSLLFIQIVISVLWLLACSIEKTEGLERGCFKLKQAMKPLLASFPLLFLALYRYFTRRNAYSVKMFEPICMFFAVLLLIVFAVRFWRFFSFKNKQRIAALLFLTFLIISTILPSFYYKLHQEPRYVSDIQYRGSSYSLKHYHMWPDSIKIFSELTFPRFIQGKYSDMVGGNVEKVAITSRSLWTLFLFIPVFIYMVTKVYTHLALRRKPDERSLIYGPFVLIIAVLLPSWHLCNDEVFRYFLPFAFGFYCAFLECVNRLDTFKIKPFMTAIILGYILYSALTVIGNTRITRFSDASVNLTGLIRRNSIDGIVAPVPLLQEVQWHTNDTVYLLDPENMNTNYYYDKEIFFSNVSRIARVNVSDRQWQKILEDRTGTFKEFRGTKKDTRIYDYRKK
ncbi:MAG: glycosyltransferase family 39 protein [Candidatus Omnitrophica bacterium]|nr:glycosyltransferase family 39 protein [Candidatus Omnitrophota bacterium]